MLMKWSDLEPGDILKLSEEFVNNFGYGCGWTNRFYNHNKNGEATVEKIICRDNTISIFFSFISVGICYNGDYWDEPNVNTPVFKIVKLREDRET